MEQPICLVKVTRFMFLHAPTGFTTLAYGASRVRKRLHHL